ncbi:hypothetical protein GH714_040180 [Hevea brasiliensis]|uniref:Uncharacterized protein n=1 Tax=Hevea brasiliensis TaxID=3981 RepID=A0A6A6MTC5_HEVBR|nr:hypothetical protein GH714_040180 [Hevea brasiliensis]
MDERGQWRKETLDWKERQWGKRFGNSGSNDNAAERGPLKCYNCQGPHLARDCPKAGGLDARVVENETPPPRQEGSSMGSMQLGAIETGRQNEVQWGNKGRLFAQIQVGQNEVQALVDTGATDNFLRLEEAQKLGVAFQRQTGWLKTVIQPQFRRMPLYCGKWECLYGAVEEEGRGRVLSAMQLAKGVKNSEPTSLWR